MAKLKYIAYHIPYFGSVLEYKETGAFPWARTLAQVSVLSPFKYWYVNHFLGASQTGGGQLKHAVGIAKDSLYRTDTSLLRSIRGPPPGAAGVMLFGTYIANLAVDNFLPTISIENQYA